MTKKRNDVVMWVLAVVISITTAFLGIQWQSAIDSAEANAKELAKLEENHKADIARLDESNRNRRNQIADLEERIARLEERTGG